MQFRAHALVSLLVAISLSWGVAPAGAVTARAQAAEAPVSVDAAALAKTATFDSGYIISNAVFADSKAMTSAQIQRFIEDSVPGCTFTSSVMCLRAYRSDSTSRPASTGGQCAAYRGGTAELASRIISKVATACHLNPRVLIVMLQKEENLVLSSAPTARAYRIAMGYGCPDSAPCQTDYYGFSNQVYRAAWQLREYLVDPTYWRYGVGQVAVKFSPTASCGAAVVDIRNQATAALYNYTPYQPDAAALADPHSSGDACSSYGNRNFWVYFREWFGSTT